MVQMFESVDQIAGYSKLLGAYHTMKIARRPQMEMPVDTAHPVVLTCWKEIACYMGKGVRTVQRWEREFGLPVRRPSGAASKSAVMARSHELDAWLLDRWSGRTRNGNSGLPSVSSVRNSLCDGIRISHELRIANHALVKEISVVLHALVMNCDQLVSKQQEYARPIDESFEMRVMETQNGSPN